MKVFKCYTFLLLNYFCEYIAIHKKIFSIFLQQNKVKQKFSRLPYIAIYFIKWKLKYWLKLYAKFIKYKYVHIYVHRCKYVHRYHVHKDYIKANNILEIHSYFATIPILNVILMCMVQSRQMSNGTHVIRTFHV